MNIRMITNTLAMRIYRQQCPDAAVSFLSAQSQSQRRYIPLMRLADFFRNSVRTTACGECTTPTERPFLGRNRTYGQRSLKRLLFAFPARKRPIGYRLEFRTLLGVGKSAMPEPAGHACRSMGIWASGSCGS